MILLIASAPLKSAIDAVVRTHSSFGLDKKPGKTLTFYLSAFLPAFGVYLDISIP